MESEHRQHKLVPELCDIQVIGADAKVPQGRYHLILPGIDSMPFNASMKVTDGVAAHRGSSKGQKLA